MNYDAMTAFHLDQQADMTMATIRVPMQEASRFGIIDVDNEYRVPLLPGKAAEHPPSNLVNMGVYVFSLDVLNEVLWEDHHRSEFSHDFGKDILPRMIDSRSAGVRLPILGLLGGRGNGQSYWRPTWTC